MAPGLPMWPSSFPRCTALKGDAGRSWAWAGVAEMVRRNAEARLGEMSP
jgi:hypothetical protein